MYVLDITGLCSGNSCIMTDVKCLFLSFMADFIAVRRRDGCFQLSALIKCCVKRVRQYFIFRRSGNGVSMWPFPAQNESSLSATCFYCLIMLILGAFRWCKRVYAARKTGLSKKNKEHSVVTDILIRTVFIQYNSSWSDPETLDYHTA